MERFRTILVEDWPQNLKNLQSELTAHCPKIEVLCTAATCKQAVEYINYHRPDLLFLDIKLPDGDGFSILEDIDQKEIVVIFTTGYKEFEYVQKAIALSAVGYLEKPIHPEKLKHAVDKATERRSEQERRKQLELILQIVQNPQNDPREIALPADGKYFFIDPKSIVHASPVKGKERTVIYYHSDDQLLEITSPCLLGKLEEIFESFPYLFRTSRADIANLYKIQTYDRGNKSLLLKGCNGHDVRVGEAYEDDFFKRLKSIGISLPR
ncbi:MAG: response regulator transcription factor [Saprospiraceae bacterium]